MIQEPFFINTCGARKVPLSWQQRPSIEMQRLYLIRGGRGYFLHADGTPEPFVRDTFYVFPHNLKARFFSDAADPIDHVFFDFLSAPPIVAPRPLVYPAGDSPLRELAALLPERGTVLVTGLGNESITPDALGPRASRMVLATRHIQGEFARSSGLDDLRATAVLAPGVLGQTGVESGEIVGGLCEVVHPAAVIAIDALASRSVARLGCTVQLCDTGIAPGSGVGNNRKELTEQLLGIPVIGLGVPTVVDARTLAAELTGREDAAEQVAPRGAQMMVTPREIDLIISRASRLVAMAVNAALQPDYSPLELIAVAAC